MPGPPERKSHLRHYLTGGSPFSVLIPQPHTVVGGIRFVQVPYTPYGVRGLLLASCLAKITQTTCAVSYPSIMTSELICIFTGITYHCFTLYWLAARLCAMDVPLSLIRLGLVSPRGIGEQGCLWFQVGASRPQLPPSITHLHT